MRDAARWLPDAIGSLRAQTFDDFEVIAADDGSTDDSRALLEAWAAEDRRVRVLAGPPRGIVAALEAARAAARGRWLARMDGDDVAAPERLERQVALMEGRPELTGCGARIRYFPRDALGDGARRYEAWINSLVEPEQIERDLFVECPLPHPTFFLRADAVQAAGGWRDAGWPEDYDLVLRLWEASGTFAKVPEVLLDWRERPDRLSRTHPAYSPDAFRRCKVQYLDRALRKGRDGVVWGAGPTGKAFARALTAARIPLRAFVELDPRKIGKRIHGAPVVAPDEIGGLRGAFCVAAVGQAGAREEIRSALDEAGWREMEEYVAVA